MGEVVLAAAQAPLVLALDAGTSSVRAIVYDARGRAIQGAAATGAVPPHATPDGGVEVNADALVACTAAVVDALARRAPAAFGAVCAVAASTSGTACSASTTRAAP